jgi:hypothetical protein
VERQLWAGNILAAALESGQWLVSGVDMARSSHASDPRLIAALKRTKVPSSWVAAFDLEQAAKVAEVVPGLSNLCGMSYPCYCIAWADSSSGIVVAAWQELVEEAQLEERGTRHCCCAYGGSADHMMGIEVA